MPVTDTPEPDDEQVGGGGPSVEGAEPPEESAGEALPEPSAGKGPGPEEELPAPAGEGGPPGVEGR